MEISADIGSNQLMLGFRQQCSVFQCLGGVLRGSPQNTLINHLVHVCQYRQGYGMWRGILWLNRICLEWLRLMNQPVREAFHKTCLGPDVLHRIWIANAKCEHLLNYATRSGLLRLSYCPCGTPMWVKTRLAASLRQGLMVILSAKSSHA